MTPITRTTKGSTTQPMNITSKINGVWELAISKSERETAAPMPAAAVPVIRNMATI